jgi:Xaa-Pro aminopeptidase
VTLGVTRAEHEGRMGRVAAECARRGLDGLLAWSRGGGTVDSCGDVLYLANHYTPIPRHQNQWPLWAGRGFAAVYVPVDGEPVLIADLPDYRADLVAVDDVRVGLNVPDEAARAIGDRGGACGRIGLAGCEIVTWESYRLLAEALPHAELVPADDVVEELRMIKSDAELDALRRAAEVGDALADAMIRAALVPGTTEAQAVAAGHAVAIERGAAIWDSAVASGPYSHYYACQGLPSWSQRPLERGDIFHVDSYGAVDGYLYDLTRSCVCGGEATGPQREVLEGAIGCIEAMIAVVRAGVPASALYRVGEAYLAERGLLPESGSAEVTVALAESFPAHGHGIGVTNERPWLRADEHLPLQESMVIAIETMAGRADVGAAGFEQDVVVTADGCEVLNRCPGVWWS